MHISVAHIQERITESLTRIPGDLGHKAEDFHGVSTHHRA